MVSLIMLVVLTLLVVAAMRSSNTNLRIAGNMQVQAEGQAAAQKVIEQVLSSDFTSDAPVGLTTTVDINNDGAADYDVVVTTPTCTSNETIRNDDLPPDDESCRGDDFNSVCARETWDVKATVTDRFKSGADMVFHQGVIRYVWTNQVHTPCKP